MGVAKLNVGYRHSVFGEGTRLIRTDYVDAAHRFARDELFDERILFGHLYNVYGKRNRDYRGKTLGHGGNNQHYAVYERIGKQPEYLRARKAVEARHEQLYHLNDEYERRGDCAYQRYEFAELCQLFLQGCARFVLVGKLARNLAEFGVVAHARNHSLAAAARYETARIEHIVALGDGSVFGLAHKICVLVHRHTLARQGALVRHKLGAVYNSAVGRQLCARFNAEYVAYNHLALGYHSYFAVAYYFYQRILADFREGLERLGAAVLHNDRNGHGNYYGNHYAHALYPVELAARAYRNYLHGDGYGERNQKNDEHRFAHRFPDSAKNGLGLFARKLVFAVYPAALFHFGGGKTLVGVYLLLRKNVARRLHILLH